MGINASDAAEREELEYIRDFAMSRQVVDEEFVSGSNGSDSASDVCVQCG